MSDLNENLTSASMHIASDMHMKSQKPQLYWNQDSGSRKGVPANGEIMRHAVV